MKKITIQLSCLLTVYAVSSCSKLEDPDALSNSERVQLIISKTILAANASDTTHVTARIPAEAGRIDVTFTTTNGSFIVAAAKTVKQIADSVSGNYRYSTTILKSDSSKGTVYITVEAGTDRNRATITFN